MNKGDFFKQRSYTFPLLMFLGGVFFISSVLYANTVNISLTILPPVGNTGINNGSNNSSNNGNNNSTGKNNSTGSIRTGFVTTGSISTGSIHTGFVTTGSISTGSIHTGFVTTGSISTGSIHTGSIVSVITETINTGISTNGSSADQDNNNKTYTGQGNAVVIKKIEHTPVTLVHNSASVEDKAPPMDSLDNSCSEETPSLDIQLVELVELVAFNGILGGIDTTVQNIANVFHFIESEIKILTGSNNEESVCSTGANTITNNILTGTNQKLSIFFSSAKTKVIDPILHFFSQLFHF